MGILLIGVVVGLITVIALWAWARFTHEYSTGFGHGQWLAMSENKEERQERLAREGREHNFQ